MVSDSPAPRAPIALLAASRAQSRLAAARTRRAHRRATARRQLDVR